MAPTDDEKRKNEDGPSPDRPKKRVNKPLIEKRRRERINECLNQLQTLISQLDKDKYKVGRPAKLEKADILEMTVEFVRKTKTNLQVNPKEDTDLHEQSYVAGYRKCMDEIQIFCKDNNVPTELKASLHDQIDLKIRQIKIEEETAVDLSTKTDKKDSKLTEQMQVFANSNPAIQPKSLPQISTANSAQVAQVQLIQRPLNGNGQLTVVCQKEPSTYVLVPAATICQPIQIPSASQNLPVILQNGAQNCELKSNMEKSGHIFPAANMFQNSGQLLMFPNSQFSIPMMNTSLSSSITLSSGYKSLPSESSLVVSTPHLPIVSSSLMSVSGAGIPTPSTHLMSTSGSPMFKQIQPSIPPHTVNGQSHNITNDLGNQIPNNNLHNDDMWRPW